MLPLITTENNLILIFRDYTQNSINLIQFSLFDEKPLFQI